MVANGYRNDAFGLRSGACDIGIADLAYQEGLGRCSPLVLMAKIRNKKQGSTDDAGDRD